MSKAVFYHAGCPVCVSAETAIVNALDRKQYKVEVVHLGESPNRVAEAETAGVTSVPAVVLEGEVLHINHGADLSALTSSTKALPIVRRKKTATAVAAAAGALVPPSCCSGGDASRWRC